MSNFKTWANNCALLADVLESVPQTMHNQLEWAAVDENDCGTIGCALGWAAMSGQFEGLGYYTTDVPFYSEPHTFRAMPTVNGELRSWEGVGDLYFGQIALTHVFYSFGSKDQTIRRLRETADKYCQMAKRHEGGGQ